MKLQEEFHYILNIEIRMSFILAAPITPTYTLKPHVYSLNPTKVPMHDFRFESANQIFFGTGYFFTFLIFFHIRLSFKFGARPTKKLLTL